MGVAELAIGKLRFHDIMAIDSHIRILRTTKIISLSIETGLLKSGIDKEIFYPKQYESKTLGDISGTQGGEYEDGCLVAFSSVIEVWGRREQQAYLKRLKTSNRLLRRQPSSEMVFTTDTQIDQIIYVTSKCLLSIIFSFSVRKYDRNVVYIFLT